jgi:hypothetical protein
MCMMDRMLDIGVRKVCMTESGVRLIGRARDVEMT